jgi:hypothetical protein
MRGSVIFDSGTESRGYHPHPENYSLALELHHRVATLDAGERAGVKTIFSKSGTKKIARVLRLSKGRSTK